MDSSDSGVGWLYIKSGYCDPVIYAHYRTLEEALTRYIVDFNLTDTMEELLEEVHQYGKIDYSEGRYGVWVKIEPIKFS